MVELDDFGREYLRLVLEINKHVKGYVDAYFGPAEIEAEVEAGGKKSLNRLRDDLAQLKESAPIGDPTRHSCLMAIFRAIDYTLRKQAGEEFSYLDEVYRLYDIHPEKVDESVFADAHRELDTLLPGRGTIADRLEDRRQYYAVPAEHIPLLLRLVRAETRRRTETFINLVEGESVEIKVVSDRPWNAYNRYRGNAQSLVEFNADARYSALRLLQLLAHEAYPGHHTENQLKEKLLYQGLGYAEYAVILLHSPTTAISEGIAVAAIDIVFPNDSHYDWINRVLLQAVGLPAEPVEQMKRIALAIETLHYVDGNAAILYHTGRLNEAQTMDYLRTYGLHNEGRAQRSFRFISDPFYRAYAFTYMHCHDLFLNAARKQDREELFFRLLVEPMLPSHLAAMA